MHYLLIHRSLTLLFTINTFHFCNRDGCGRTLSFVGDQSTSTELAN